MKKILSLLGWALLMASTFSCGKIDDGKMPDLYRIGRDGQTISTTTSPTDFSNIYSVVDRYINTDYNSEKEALNAYKDVLSQTKDAKYTANNGSYYKILINKYVARKLDEHSYEYVIDNSYKSPVSHIWDKDGSRDL